MPLSNFPNGIRVDGIATIDDDAAFLEFDFHYKISRIGTLYN